MLHKVENLISSLFNLRLLIFTDYKSKEHQKFRRKKYSSRIENIMEKKELR